jgi:hypothetical protein
MKTFISIVRDHSASMSGLAKGALNDYNILLEGIKQSMAEEKQEAFLSVVQCGVGRTADVVREKTNVPLDNVVGINSYLTNGNATPLFDSIGEAIKAIEEAPYKDVADPTTAFLVMIITDGEENASRNWSVVSLRNKISELQATDKWTFVFRVPRGSKQKLMQMGFHEGNILEWDQNEKALAASTVATVSSTKEYFKSRSTGKTSSTSFYTNLADLSAKDVAKTLDRVYDYKISDVEAAENGKAIREFCLDKFGTFSPGHALYELTKRETVQEYKKICIRDRKTGEIFAGHDARSMLGLPTYGNIRLIPDNHGQFELYVQSNSVNRKLVTGTKVIYLP